MKKTRNAYEHAVAEVFGYPPDAPSDGVRRSWNERLCPFIGARCVKLSQHRDYDSAIPFGACSVWHRGRGAKTPQPYIICPVRFTQGHTIFTDADRLQVAPPGTKTIVLPEVSLSMGRIDYMLARFDPVLNKAVDFLVLEVMACSTTTTGDILRSFHDALKGLPTKKVLKYGINFRQVVSRMMVQILAKAFACEKWQRRMIWAIQDVLYDYMRATTRLDLPPLTPASLLTDNPNARIVFFVYKMERPRPHSRFELKLDRIYGGTREHFARVFEPVDLPEAEDLLGMLTDRIRRNDRTFSIDAQYARGLAEAARDMVRED